MVPDPYFRICIIVFYNFTSFAGDIVCLRETGPDQGRQVLSGVVINVTQSSIRITVEDDVDELDSLSDDVQLQLHKLSNDVCTFPVIGLSSVDAEMVHVT